MGLKILIFNKQKYVKVSEFTNRLALLGRNTLYEHEHSRDFIYGSLSNGYEMNKAEFDVWHGFWEDNDELGYPLFVLYILMIELDNDYPIFSDKGHQYSFRDQNDETGDSGNYICLQVYMCLIQTVHIRR